MIVKIMKINGKYSSRGQADFGALLSTHTIGCGASSNPGEEEFSASFIQKFE